MVFEKDFREFCSLLNEEKIDYLIVGGYAVAFHGAPRATGDIDILIRPEHEQVVRLLTAIERFGFPTAGVTPEYLLVYSKILQLGRVPVPSHISPATHTIPIRSLPSMSPKLANARVNFFQSGPATNVRVAGRNPRRLEKSIT